MGPLPFMLQCWLYRVQHTQQLRIADNCFDACTCADVSLQQRMAGTEQGVLHNMTRNSMYSPRQGGRQARRPACACHPYRLHLNAAAASHNPAPSMPHTQAEKLLPAAAKSAHQQPYYTCLSPTANSSRAPFWHSGLPTPQLSCSVRANFCAVAALSECLGTLMR